jgi:hypothetical protein
MDSIGISFVRFPLRTLLEGMSVPPFTPKVNAAAASYSETVGGIRP